MDLLSLADRSWPVVRRLADGHARLYRLTDGLIGHRIPGLAPMLLLDHVGARTGIKRITPLSYDAARVWRLDPASGSPVGSAIP